MAYEGFNEFFLTAELNACINRFPDRSKNFFVLTVAIMILLNQHQYVVNIDFHLLDKFDFKFNIVCNIFFFGIAFSTVLIVEVKIDTLIILQISCDDTVHFCKLVKGRKNVSHTEDLTEQSDKIFLCLFSDNLTIKRIFRFQLFKQINIAGVIPAIVVLIAVPVIIEAL